MAQWLFLWSLEDLEFMLMFHLNINFGFVVSIKIPQERFRITQMR